MLTPSEQLYWNNSTREQQYFIITGDSQEPLECTHYQARFFCSENLNLFVNPAQPVQQHHQPIQQPQQHFEPYCGTKNL